MLNSLIGRLTNELKDPCKHWIVVIALFNSSRSTSNSDLERSFFLARALSSTIVPLHFSMASVVSFTISAILTLSFSLSDCITSLLYLSKDKARDLNAVRSKVIWFRPEILACSRAFSSSAVLMQCFFTSMAALTRLAVAAVSPRQLH